MADVDEPYLAALDEYSKLVELMTGIKAQFVEAGWYPAHAEVATIELVLGRGGKK